MMKKNSQIHLWIETDLLEKLKKQAEENKVLLSDLCREKLRGNSSIDRIEFIAEKMERLFDLSQRGSRQNVVLSREKF